MTRVRATNSRLAVSTSSCSTSSPLPHSAVLSLSVFPIHSSRSPPTVYKGDLIELERECDRYYTHSRPCV
ncbi:hypothetical protein FA13DRAFT_1739489 [Coprinellus micaceus]|uniref:Uncharacterized protein n=1 Tax=Coprinellus micaceus TaxID=71717 RepID=A0A4Y7SR54_COPMI|nr:hypothetical protein FA13DRAFT_1739489 [Coprinellus micaceus]